MSRPHLLFCLQFDFYMPNRVPLSDFQLPEGVHPRIQSFYQLWLDAGDGEVPASSCFDIAALSAEYPLLASIKVQGPEEVFVWHEVAAVSHWPFNQPVKGRPVIESVRPLSVKRILGTLRQISSSSVPDYYETTSWMYGGRTQSLARLVVPVAADGGRELISLWEAMDPMHS